MKISTSQNYIIYSCAEIVAREEAIDKAISNLQDVINNAGTWDDNWNVYLFGDKICFSLSHEDGFVMEFKLSELVKDSLQDTSPSGLTKKLFEDDRRHALNNLESQIADLVDCIELLRSRHLEVQLMKFQKS